MTRDEIAEVIIGRLIAREGGIADVGDGKGVTRFGQTDGWLTQYGLPQPADARQAADNYRRWLDLTGLIALCDVADSLADGVIDYAVHSGAGVAVKALQKALGVKADGVVGPVTRAALTTMTRGLVARRVLADRARLWGAMFAHEPQRYGRFAYGWLCRLASQIEALE